MISLDELLDRLGFNGCEAIFRSASGKRDAVVIVSPKFQGCGDVLGAQIQRQQEDEDLLADALAQGVLRFSQGPGE